MGIQALLPTQSHGMNEIKAVAVYCNPHSIKRVAWAIMEGPCPRSQRPLFGSFRILVCAGKAETRHGRCESSLSPYPATSGPLGCPFPGPCLLPTCLINCTPAYMAFPSLQAPSSSASSSCVLCFSLSSEALAWQASSLHRAVNSPRAALRTGWGPH